MQVPNRVRRRLLRLGGAALIAAGGSLAWSGAARAKDVSTQLQWPGAGRAELSGQLRRSGLSLSIRGELTWAFDSTARQYRLGMEAWTGLGVLKEFAQTSSGRIGAQGLMPELFTDRRLMRSERVTRFAPGASSSSRRIVFPKRQTLDDAPLAVQDRLSVLFQLAAQVAAGGPSSRQPGSTQRLVTAGNSTISDWLFRFEPPARTAWQGRQVDAIHLVRQPRDADDPRFEVWLVPSLQHLPVRSLTTEDDDSLEQVMVDIAS